MKDDAYPFVDVIKDQMHIARATRFVRRSDVDPVEREPRTMVGFWSPVGLRTGDDYRLILPTGEQLLVRIWMSPAGATSTHPVRVTARVLSGHP